MQVTMIIGYETTMAALQCMAKDGRSHKDLVTDVQYTVRDMFPAPVAKAITTVAARNGWHAECLAQEVVASAAFCEHPGTRLKAHMSEWHSRSPCIAYLRGASMSARKSSLKTYGDDLVFKNPASPQNFKDRAFIAADSTLRALREHMQKHQHCAIISDECSNTYETPWSEGGKGLHYLIRSKVCTYVNAESDDSTAETFEQEGHVRVPSGPC